LRLLSIILIYCVKDGTVRSVPGRWFEVQFPFREINFSRQLEDRFWGPPSPQHNEFKEIFHFWPFCCLRRHNKKAGIMSSQNFLLSAIQGERQWDRQEPRQTVNGRARSACVIFSVKKVVILSNSDNATLHVKSWSHLAEKTSYRVHVAYKESPFAIKVTISVEFLFYTTCLLVLWPSNIEQSPLQESLTVFMAVQDFVPRNLTATNQEFGLCNTCRFKSMNS